MTSAHQVLASINKEVCAIGVVPKEYAAGKTGLLSMGVMENWELTGLTSVSLGQVDCY